MTHKNQLAYTIAETCFVTFHMSSKFTTPQLCSFYASAPSSDRATGIWRSKNGAINAKQRTLLIFFLIFTIGLSQQGLSQEASVPPHTFGVKKYAIPTLFIGAGLLLNHSKAEHQFQVNLRNKVGNDYSNHIDNYLPFAPVAELYIADIAGMKGKNHWFDQSKYLFLSNFFTGIITHGIKQLTQKERPYGGNYSFPSGHTSLAFTNATVLYQEFKDSAPLFAYSGYLFAGTTGTFRMLNNKHWISDVLVGAGIGILATELVYYFEPLKNFNPFKKSKNISLIPQFGKRDYRLYFSCNF